MPVKQSLPSNVRRRDRPEVVPRSPSQRHRDIGIFMLAGLAQPAHRSRTGTPFRDDYQLRDGEWISLGVTTHMVRERGD